MPKPFKKKRKKNCSYQCSSAACMQAAIPSLLESLYPRWLYAMPIKIIIILRTLVQGLAAGQLTSPALVGD